jgi:polar amino acid transport system substrate-binding protein
MKMRSLAAGIALASITQWAVAAPTLEAARAELAPTGKIRLAIPAYNPNYLSQPAQAPYSGVAVDIANALSKKVGIGYELVQYQTNAEMITDASTGKWDVALTGIEESRRAVIDFSSAYAVTPNSYLVPAGSALMTFADIDKADVRVGAAANTMQYNHLKASLRNAKLVSGTNVTALATELKEGRADAVAANRPMAEALAKSMPGYRVLPGSFMDVAYGVAVPKGRSAAAAVVDELVREMRARGVLAATLARAKVSGLAVPAN